MLALRLLHFAAASLLFFAPVAAAGDWGLEWDVRLEDEELAEELEGYFGEAAAFFAAKGFPAPLVTGESCGAQSPVVVEEMGLHDNLGARMNNDNCTGNGIYYCVFPGEGDCPRALLVAWEERLLGLEPEFRKRAVARNVFRGVMNAYDGYREGRPITKEYWFSEALPRAAAEWWLDTTGDYDHERAYNDSLHAPLGQTRSQVGWGPESNDWETQSLRTQRLWTWFRDIRRTEDESYEWGRILEGALRDRWSYKVNDLFYLDLLDAGLHQLLVDACDDQLDLSQLGGRAGGGRDRGVCAGLCGGDQPLHIRYLDVEEDHSKADYQVCANPIGGLYFIYPAFGTAVAETRFDEVYFQNRPGRDYPDGCIPASVNRVDSGQGGSSFAEVTLSIPPVAFECVALSDVPEGFDAVVSVRSLSEEIIDQIHLSYNHCARTKTVIHDPIDGSWLGTWMMGQKGVHPACAAAGDEVRLVITNVAKRASETVPAENLRLRIYPAAGEAN